MRQDHQRHGQNHRGQQRPRNKNRNQNFAQRTLDSNGPDVKIRGTAAHICKKYQTLARDAQSLGDRIRAENYLQHADHYYRLVMAAQSQQQQAQSQPPPQPRHPDESKPFSPDEQDSYKNGATEAESFAKAATEEETS